MSATFIYNLCVKVTNSPKDLDCREPAYCILSAALSTASSFRIWNSSSGILSLLGASVRNSAHDKGHEEGGSQRRDRASGVPLEILEHLPPKPVCLLSALCSHLQLWLYGGLSPTTSFGEGVNLELQLIKTPGCDKSVLTYNLLWRFSSLPNRLVRPHVIAHSLPTMRGTRCFKPSKNRFLRKVRKLLV